jgi:hypothetical protein
MSLSRMADVDRGDLATVKKSNNDGGSKNTFFCIPVLKNKREETGEKYKGRKKIREIRS